MKLLIRLLSMLIVLALAVAALGYFAPERFFLLGAMGGVLLVPTTAALGIVQLVQARKRRQSV